MTGRGSGRGMGGAGRGMGGVGRLGGGQFSRGELPTPIPPSGGGGRVSGSWPSSCPTGGGSRCRRGHPGDEPLGVVNPILLNS